MGEVYVIVSGKGGVGKTTSAVNLGTSMNSCGSEVIIVDANLTTPNIGLHLGAPIAPITINHVMFNKARPEEAIYEHDSGTKIMPASLSIDEIKNLEHKRLNSIVKRLRKIADHIILDSSAGLGDESKAAIKSADKIIIVTNPEMAAVTDALKTIKLAEQMKKDVIGCIITRHLGHKRDLSLDTVSHMLEIPILGIIPEDKAIKESHYLKNAVIYTHPKSKAAKAYHKTAKRILGPKYIIKQSEKSTGIIGKLLNKILGKNRAGY